MMSMVCCVPQIALRAADQTIIGVPRLLLTAEELFYANVITFAIYDIVSEILGRCCRMKEYLFRRILCRLCKLCYEHSKDIFAVCLRFNVLLHPKGHPPLEGTVTAEGGQMLNENSKFLMKF